MVKEITDLKKLKLKQTHQMNTDKLPLWNVPQAAEYLNLSPRTVRDLVYKRQIPYRKAGRCVRFNPTEIEQWTIPTNN